MLRLIFATALTPPGQKWAGSLRVSMRVILRYLDKATIFINLEVHKVHADDASHIVVFMRLRQPFALLVRLGSFEHLGRNLAHVVVCVRVCLSEALGYEPARS